MQPAEKSPWFRYVTFLDFILFTAILLLLVVILLLRPITAQQLDDFIKVREEKISLRQFLQLRQFVLPLPAPIVPAQHRGPLLRTHPFNDVHHSLLDRATPLELLVHLMLQRVPAAQGNALPDLAEHLEPVALRLEVADGTFPALLHDMLDVAVDALHNFTGNVALLGPGKFAISDVQVLPHVLGVEVEVEDGVLRLLFLLSDHVTDGLVLRVERSSLPVVARSNDGEKQRNRKN